jgi:hypothetical protein
LFGSGPDCVSINIKRFRSSPSCHQPAEILGGSGLPSIKFMPIAKKKSESISEDTRLSSRNQNSSLAIVQSLANAPDVASHNRALSFASFSEHKPEGLLVRSQDKYVGGKKIWPRILDEARKMDFVATP